MYFNNNYLEYFHPRGIPLSTSNQAENSPPTHMYCCSS